MTNIEHSTPSSGSAPWVNATLACLETIRRSVSDWRRRSAFRQEIAALERAGTLDAILEDLGLSRWEMDKVADGFPEAERLLPNMANRRGIDLGKVEADSLYELRHTCSICAKHRACRRFLAAGGEGDASFCPNSALFAKLQAPRAKG